MLHLERERERERESVRARARGGGGGALVSSTQIYIYFGGGGPGRLCEISEIPLVATTKIMVFCCHAISIFRVGDYHHYPEDGGSEFL
jgi:hypothetical protein